MKIAILGDTHLGYSRFEDDSLKHAEKALLDADQKADVIIHAGDLFDIKVPKLETINQALQLFKKLKKPVIAIFGNHERRSKDMINPVQLLANAGVLEYLHGTEKQIEMNGEKLQIFGMSSVPEELASTAIKTVMKNYSPKEDAFKILVIHQSIKELGSNSDNELSLEELEPLQFDLIINGHIHKRESKLNGKFLIPGSTVLTQLKKDETEPKVYLLYDTKTRTFETIDFGSRKFFFEDLIFSGAGIQEVKSAVDQKIIELKQANPDSIIKIKIKGTLKEGLDSKDISFPMRENVYIDNDFESASIREKIEKIRSSRTENLSIKEFIMKQLAEKVNGKISIDSYLLFEKLLEGPDETIEWLKTHPLQ
ncbi:MAG: DNA repair exonuclease [Candidatus Micrarchaeota archaeon]